MIGKLYVLGTPIGNLSDFSPRGVETLNKVDFIAAEDTRVTSKLLNHFDIKKPMISYFEHNRFEKGQIIVDRILSGETCAIVTDAGMPAISDPGQLLVKQALDNGITVVSVPGPSAFVSALSVSGCKTDRFCFEGFLSVDKKKRREHLEQIQNETRTICFYEAPHKLKNTLKDLYETLGDRDVTLVREITKIHEETINFNLKSHADIYADNEPKGEFVIIIDGVDNVKKKQYTMQDAVEMVSDFVNDGMSVSAAARRTATETKIKKGDIYSAYLKSVEKKTAIEKDQ